MNRKRKVGILLVLIGVSIPSVLYFFQDDGVLFTIHSTKIFEKKKVTPEQLIKIEEYLKNEWHKIQRTKVLKKEGTMYKIEEAVRQLMNRVAMRGLMADSLEFFNQDLKIATETIHNEIPIPHRPFVGIGILIALIGFGMFIFSFSPKDKPKKVEGEE